MSRERETSPNRFENTFPKVLDVRVQKLAGRRTSLCVCYLPAVSIKAALRPKHDLRCVHVCAFVFEALSVRMCAGMYARVVPGDDSRQRSREIKFSHTFHLNSVHPLCRVLLKSSAGHPETFIERQIGS